MSKAFTKDDQDETLVVVPARAPLPSGTPNYVTAHGMGLLREEQRSLSAERARLEASAREPEGIRVLGVLSQRLRELEQRLASASLVQSAGQPRDEVRFGACVTLRSEAGSEQRYRIVGVDEADPSQDSIAFVAPLARALLGRRVGESFVLRSPRGDEELEVLAIGYESL